MLDFLPNASVFPRMGICGVTVREGYNPLVGTSYSMCSRAQSSHVPCSGRIPKVAILTPPEQGVKTSTKWAQVGSFRSVCFSKIDIQDV